MIAPLVVRLPSVPDPISALSVFAGDPLPVLLHSPAQAGGPHDAGRWSILCSQPLDVIRWSAVEGGDPFARLASRLAELGPAAPGLGPFAGGAVGYIGYGAGSAVERVVPGRAGRGRPLPGVPDMMFGLYAWGVVWDHRDGVAALVCTGLPERGSARAGKARDDADALARRLAGVPSPPAPVSAGGPAGPAREARILSSSLPRPDYIEAVGRARRLIAAGDVYQVNLSQRLELEAPRSSLSLFARLVEASPSPFSAWLDAGGFQVACASPERFVSLRGGAVECRPIKGTRPRGAGAARDELLRRELIGSAKDRAENVMIVDLVRNDLGRVCRAGSVEATEICRVETYASVHHLVSIVRGELDDGLDRADLLRALFPGGSMTGAPKRSAMQAIEDLETVPRGIYSGAIGYLSLCGAMDLNIVIRTAIVTGGRAWVQVGGGVVADSDPEAEYRESLDKARSLLEALSLTG